MMPKTASINPCKSKKMHLNDIYLKLCWDQQKSEILNTYWAFTIIPANIHIYHFYSPFFLSFSNYFYWWHKTNFFKCYLAAPRSTLGHHWEGSFTHPMLITAFSYFRPKGHREPRDELGSFSPAEHLVGFQPENFNKS